MLELLSPAKDLEAGIAAVDYGADAVYIGGPAFSARQAAHNSLENLESLLHYAHQFRAKVYVVLNTLLKDEELVEAEKLIWELYKIKVDALIIQDMGLLELNLPPIALFASTQTTNITAQKVLFLQDRGFKRVILERALALNEIKEIRAQTTVELECFVHGALCVSYSGQCFLSYALGGRSANRGQCAQPCRKPYTLVDSNNLALLGKQPLLSLKDLNLSEHLSELIAAGITSFKIEGRLKDLNYVKNITAFYRQKLDEIIKAKKLQKSSSGGSEYSFTPNPDKTFNRGYTTYFTTGNNRDLSARVSGSLGEYLGTVAETKRHAFSLSLEQTVIPGDGCCFIDETREVQGFFVNKVVNGVITPNKPMFFKKGTKIFRNYDKSFLKILCDSPTKRRLAVEWLLREEPHKLVLTALDEFSNKAEATLILNDSLQKQSADYEQRIKEVFEKIGHTIFATTKICTELSFQAFIPLSLLKQTRNEMLDNLLQKIQSEYKPNKLVASPHQAKPKQNQTPDRFDSSLHVLNQKAETFFLGHHLKVNLGAVETSNLIPETQQLMTTKYCLLKEHGLCLKEPPATFALPLYLEDKGTTLRLDFDCNSCEMKVY